MDPEAAEVDSDVPPPSLGPEIVAGVFKVAAPLVLVVVTIAALAAGVDLRANAGHATVVGLIVEGAGVLASSAVAFFAYVLDLLVSIRDNTDAMAEVALADD